MSNRFIPPALGARRPAFTRPSGDAFDGIEIENLPAGARVFVDGAEIPTVGGRRIPFTGRGMILRVQTADGSEARATDQSGYGGFSSGAGFDWNTLEPVAAVADALPEFRILNAPAGGGTVWVDGVPVAPLPPTPPWNGHIIQWPAGEVAVRVQMADGSVRSKLFTVPGNLDYNSMNVVSGPTVVGVGIGMGAPPAPPATGTLVLRGARAGWTAALARINPSPAPIGAITFDATGTFTQAGLPVGSYAILVGRAGGDNQSRTVMISAGATTTEDVGAYFPTAADAARATLTVSGQPGWKVAIANVGSTMPLVPVATMPESGVIAVQWPVGRYDLGVNNGTQTVVRTITVPPEGVRVETRIFFPAVGSPPPPPPPPARETQGPTAASATTGTILLTGAPPTSTVRCPPAAEWRVNDSARPVAIDLPAGTYALTVVPPGSATRVASVIVRVGETTTVAYGGMPTPSAVTAGDSPMPEIQVVNEMCGPVLNRAAWMPPTACPGQEIIAPDGVKWRAIAAAGGVQMAALKADGTVDASWSTGGKVAVVLAVGALGVGAWYFLKGAPQSPQNNPGKCSCQH
jgi:hypothetical protein